MEYGIIEKVHAYSESKWNVAFYLTEKDYIDAFLVRLWFQFRQYVLLRDWIVVYHPEKAR